MTGYTDWIKEEGRERSMEWGKEGRRKKRRRKTEKENFNLFNITIVVAATWLRDNTKRHIAILISSLYFVQTLLGLCFLVCCSLDWKFSWRFLFIISLSPRMCTTSGAQSGWNEWVKRGSLSGLITCKFKVLPFHIHRSWIII